MKISPKIMISFNPERGDSNEIGLCYHHFITTVYRSRWFLQPSRNFRGICFFKVTLPETKIAPGNRWKLLFQPQCFRCEVIFRKGSDHQNLNQSFNHEGSSLVVDNVVSIRHPLALLLYLTLYKCPCIKKTAKKATEHLRKFPNA